MLIVPGGGVPTDKTVKILAPGDTGSAGDGEIVLQTSRRQEIRNTQYAKLGTFDPTAFQRLARDSAGVERSNLSPRYNCHGMTFASRRTCIDEAGEVWKIIHDDGYVEIDIRRALPGDIVLYLGEDGDVDHSAMVVQSARYEQDGRLIEYPMVVGKWGKYREVVHRANRSPYGNSTKYFRCNHDPS